MKTVYFVYYEGPADLHVRLRLSQLGTMQRDEASDRIRCLYAWTTDLKRLEEFLSYRNPDRFYVCTHEMKKSKYKAFKKKYSKFCIMPLGFNTEDMYIQWEQTVTMWEYTQVYDYCEIRDNLEFYDDVAQLGGMFVYEMFTRVCGILLHQIGYHYYGLENINSDYFNVKNEYMKAIGYNVVEEDTDDDYSILPDYYDDFRIHLTWLFGEDIDNPIDAKSLDPSKVFMYLFHFIF